MLETFQIAYAHPQLHAIEPIGYHDSLYLSEHAKLVVTDSGGLQEETTYFKTPCLTLRPNTERPVTVSLGTNKLSVPEALSQDIEAILSATETKGDIPPLWDGKTAERVTRSLLNR
jgi:UDP-N-acetylglucosamine 2-epimerase (non-hydrolysing)